MKVGVIGIGMVGTPMARYFGEVRGLERGRDLFLYDKDPQKGYLDDINQADLIFISVPTPSSDQPAGGGSADLSALEDAFSKIQGEKIVVIRSTVPPGTTEAFQKKYPQHKILFNPEFLTAKRAWEDFLKPDRQIVGFTPQSLEAAQAVLALLPKAPFMSPWGINTTKQIRITAAQAEIIKYASNLHYYRKVNWANALAKVAQRLGEDFENIRLAMAADFRIGDSHLDVEYGGYRGVGGHCLPKDLKAFQAHCRELGLPEVSELLESDRLFNEKLLKEQGLPIDKIRGKGI